MNFSVGIIVAVGLLVSGILVMIALDPGYVSGPPVEPVEEPVVCTMEYAPVCGVDGKTYGNQCMLDAEGVSLAHAGECAVMSEPELKLEPVPEPAPVKVETNTMPAMPVENSVMITEGSSISGCEETNECYLPYAISVPIGGTVLWTNEDAAAHTVTSGTVADGPDGLFDSGLFMSGETFDFTFNESGSYDYFCLVHPWMTGVVLVDNVEEMIVEPEPEPEIASETSSLTATVTTAVGSGTPGCEETNECYLPYEVIIDVGGTVIWENVDSAAHTVTSGTMPEGPSGVFDSGLFMSGNTFQFTFNESGTYDYFCMVHPWMTGKVIVE